MTRSSPGVKRVAAILNFMASHPGQSFALSDLVRALKLSRATCHALLTGLIDVGYLYRTSDKTYVLGPALAAIGRAASGHTFPLQVAQPEMRKLADDFDVVCGAYFLEGDLITLRDRAASLSHVGYPVPLGTRMKLRSPQAVAFFAFSPTEADHWLAHSEPKPSAELRTLVQDSMAFVRQHGFAVLIRRPGFDLSGEIKSLDAGFDLDEPPVAPIAQLDASQIYPIGALMAPVLDSAGKAAFCLVMAGFNSAMSGAQILKAGESLAATCKRISVFSGTEPARAVGD